MADRQEQQPKTFYEFAKENYIVALNEKSFFDKRRPLRTCVDYLVKAYKKGEVGTLDGLPEDTSGILHFDKEETSGLIERLNDFFMIEEEDKSQIVHDNPVSC